MSQVAGKVKKYQIFFKPPAPQLGGETVIADKVQDESSIGFTAFYLHGELVFKANRDAVSHIAVSDYVPTSEPNSKS